MKFRVIAGLASVALAAIALTSCGDDEPSPKGGGGDNDKPAAARSLTVTVDESQLTYENLEIVLSNGATFKYENVPFGTVAVTIEDFPRSVEELERLKLPNGMTDIHQNLYLQPLLMVCALNELNYDRDVARAMIDYVGKGVKSQSRDGELIHYPGEGVSTADPTEWSQAKQYSRFDKVRSYFEGATSGNNYTPATKPYVMKLELNNYSYTADKDCVQIWLTSTQLASKKPLQVWKYDSDGDGSYDYFWTSTFRSLLHSLAEY